MGLNSYETRPHLVLVGHSRFKAIELAAKAHVPRQKIYEVLDSLVEKGFARVVQEKTKLFSAVEPRQRGVSCRWLADSSIPDDTRLIWLREYAAASSRCWTP